MFAFQNPISNRSISALLLHFKCDKLTIYFDKHDHRFNAISSFSFAFASVDLKRKWFVCSGACGISQKSILMTDEGTEMNIEIEMAETKWRRTTSWCCPNFQLIYDFSLVGENKNERKKSRYRRSRSIEFDSKKKNILILLSRRCGFDRYKRRVQTYVNWWRRNVHIPSIMSIERRSLRPLIVQESKRQIVLWQKSIERRKPEIDLCVATFENDYSRSI